MMRYIVTFALASILTIVTILLAIGALYFICAYGFWSWDWRDFDITIDGIRHMTLFLYIVGMFPSWGYIIPQIK